ncbi:hypothetical protein [Sulfuricurvum sp.]|uniref:hypothetical protein n=1 Tax=Sulfuricurvum sp. TaxID=2025608 RepID=UPI00263414F1|nr:hypothetical protein [Sulfuricurvum sp.]MDD2839409.1 hypothetical protein [Sulfuricurvum sp.]MDD3595671.1 hypothetical protein [Sulfuricurvum sp.]MDD4884327.1 hypothetical protein [Sulfuricurvum sp.]
MAKRVIKDERIKVIIHNIAEDFRFSHETGDYALLFYKADTEGIVRGSDIESMIEYLTTGLSELQDNIQWRREFLNENTGIDEMRMLENLSVIEKEYLELLEFLR